MYQNYYGYPAQGQLEQYKQPYMQQFNQANPSLPQGFTQAQPSSDERIWVSGIEQAQNYLMTPNSFVRLWDSSTNCFYEKRTDQSGRPYLETYEYSRKGGSPQNMVQVDFSEQIKSLEMRIKALEENKMNNPLQMISEFNKFKQSFQGDPKAEVQKLVASGRINQQQLNQLQQMASQFQNMMRNIK